MKEPVRVVHGRYGCKSAYETYKRFARTNTRLGVRPRRGHERVGGKDAGGKKRGLGLRWIQMRINIYKRVRRWSSLLDSYLESGCGRCEEILVLAPPCEMRNTRRKAEGRRRKKRGYRGSRIEGREWNIRDIESPWPNLTGLEFSVDDEYLVDFHVLTITITLRKNSRNWRDYSLFKIFLLRYYEILKLFVLHLNCVRVSTFLNISTIIENDSHYRQNN